MCLSLILTRLRNKFFLSCNKTSENLHYIDEKPVKAADGAGFEGIKRERGDQMERNAEAFAAKYQEIYQDMFRFALYTLKNRQEAEDAVSETVLDAWKGIEGLKNESAFQAWIFRILVNKCRRRLKAYLNNTIELSSDLAWRERDTSEDMDVRAAFYGLNDEERLVLSMNLFGGYKGREIAAMLDMNENTVRSLKSRALKKMEQILTAGEE